MLQSERDFDNIAKLEWPVESRQSGMRLIWKIPVGLRCFYRDGVKKYEKVTGCINLCYFFVMYFRLQE